MTAEQNDRLEALGRQIRRHRELAGLTQAEVARRMTERGTKTHRTRIVAWENGRNELRGTAYQVLAEVLTEAAVPAPDPLPLFRPDVKP